MAHSDNCHHLLDSLSDYIDGTLRQDLCDQLETHMKDCENCRIVVDTLKKTIYLYRIKEDNPEIPDDMRERLFTRLDLQNYISEVKSD